MKNREGHVAVISLFLFGFFLGTRLEITPQNQNDLDGEPDHEDVPDAFARLFVDLELDTEG